MAADKGAESGACLSRVTTWRPARDVWPRRRKKEEGLLGGRDWRKIEFLALPTSSRLIGRSRLLFT